MPNTLPTQSLAKLAIEFFRDHSRVNVGDSLRFTGAFHMKVHHHPDLLQLNLFRGCVGEVTVNGSLMPLRGAAATTNYPGDSHGFDVTPADGGVGETLVLKLRVKPSWPAIRGRIFDAFASPVRGELLLTRAMRRATRLSGLSAAPGPVHAARIAELLCAWPGPGQNFLIDSAAAEPELDAPMRAVLQAIEQRTILPSVNELAEMVELSTRHFARRFRQAMGVAPRDFIEARRLERAQELLAHGDMTIDQVGEATGFGSLAAFSRWFSRQTGVAPSRFRAIPRDS